MVEGQTLKDHPLGAGGCTGMGPSCPRPQGLVCVVCVGEGCPRGLCGGAQAGQCPGSMGSSSTGPQPESPQRLSQTGCLQRGQRWGSQDARLPSGAGAAVLAPADSWGARLTYVGVVGAAGVGEDVGVNFSELPTLAA